MEPEFGGAKPRHAYLDLDMDALSAKMVDKLWGNVTNNMTGVQRTDEVTVYFVSAQSLLLRVPPKDAGSDAIFELDRSVIRAIIWTD